MYLLHPSMVPALSSAQIVKPLWEPFVALFPRLQPLLESLNENCEYYRREGLRLERLRLPTTSKSSRDKVREGHGNDGEDPGGSNDGSDGNVNNGDGGGRACGGDDQASPPTKEERAGAGKAVAGEKGSLRPVSSNEDGGGGGG